MEVSEFCGSSFCYLQDTSSCSSMVKYDWNAAVSRNRCGHLVRTAKDCHSFIEEFATSEQLTRQQHGNNSFQWFSNHQPRRSKKSVPCCRRSEHQTHPARVSMLASKIFLEKPSAMQPHRPGDHGQRPFVPGAPLAPPAAPWGGRAGSPAMKLGRSENDAQVTDLPGRTHLADQSDFWPFRYSQAAGSSPVSPSMPSPRPRDFADVAWMHRFKQDYTYFAGY